MTLNGEMAVSLRYFTEFDKPVLQKTICGRIYARVYCIFSACTTSSQRKFTFAISSPDEFLVHVGARFVLPSVTAFLQRHWTQCADATSDASGSCVYDLSY